MDWAKIGFLTLTSNNVAEVLVWTPMMWMILFTACVTLF
jgi:hypothetical protein